MTKVVISGAKGRMGQSLIACATRFPDLQVVGKIDIGDDLEAALQNADVLIDFSFHSGTAVMAEACARHKAAMIIGTTGHQEEEKKRILAQTTAIPIVWASNYSTG